MDSTKPQKSSARKTPPATGVAARRKRKRAGERRTDIREQLWPGSEAEIWNRLQNHGFCTIPRLLPLICALIKQLSKSGDASSVYLDLWSRAFDEGYVAIRHEDECAFSSGYSGPRATRTWTERMELLEELGFIRCKSAGIRRFAHVLIVNPLLVIAHLRSKGKPRVPDEWWAAYIVRADEIGAELPPVE